MRKTTPLILLSALWALALYGTEETAMVGTKSISALQLFNQGLTDIEKETEGYNPYASVAKLEIYKEYREKTAAVDAFVSGAQWGIISAALKAGYDIASPSVMGALVERAPQAAMTVDSWLQNVPDNAFLTAALAVSLGAALRTGVKKWRNPELDPETHDMVTDILVNSQKTRIGLQQTTFQAGLGLEKSLQSANSSVNERLNVYAQKHATFKQSLSSLENQKAGKLAQHSQQLNTLLNEIDGATSTLQGGAQAQQKAVSFAQTEETAQVEKKEHVKKSTRQKLAGLLGAAGLTGGAAGVFHRAGAKTRSYSGVDINISPEALVVASCSGALLAAADYMHKGITTDFHQKLRPILYGTVQKNLESAQANTQDAISAIMIQNDVNTQALTTHASLLTAAMEDAEKLLNGIRENQLTADDFDNNTEHPTLKAQNEVIEAAQSTLKRNKQQLSIITNLHEND
jgi:hypothetical protein